MTPRSAVLELHAVTKTYPGEPPVHALRGITLRVHAGELVAIVGPSGSGKTTLLHLMGTLDRPSSGTVRLTGLDVAELSDRELAGLRATRIGFVFQQFFLAEHATVLDNVADGLLYAGVAARERRDRAADALAAVDLGNRLHARPTQLSGGQRQRVVIARALAPRPTLLVADEPVSMLDVSLRAGVLELLGELRRTTGVSLLYITHDLLSARLVADRMLVLHEGRVVEQGPTVDVLRNPKDDYTRALLDALPTVAN